MGMAGTISMIAAIGERNRIIGRNNDLPFSARLKPDMHRFKELTTGHPVIMGRATWDSIPEKFRPLPGRTNIVVTHTQEAMFHGAYASHSIYAALQFAEHFEGSDEIFLIGGQRIYDFGIKHADRLYLTLVDEDPEGDRLFPGYPEFTKVIEREVVPDFVPRLTFLTLERG